MTALNVKSSSIILQCIQLIFLLNNSASYPKNMERFNTQLNTNHLKNYLMVFTTSILNYK